MTRQLSAISLVLLLCLVSTQVFSTQVAHAQGRSVRELSERELQAYQTLLTEATLAYGEGRYDDAVATYTRAKTMVQDPDLDYNIGRSYDKMGKCSVAQTYYEKVLKLGKARQENLTKAKKHLAALGPCPKESKKVALLSDSPDQTDKRPKKKDSQETSALFWTGLTSAIVGGATLGVGLGLDVTGVSLKDDYKAAAQNGDKAQYDALADDIASRQSLVFTLYGVGAGLVVIGGVLMAVDGMGESSPEASAEGVFAPIVTPDHVGATWNVAW